MTKGYISENFSIKGYFSKWVYIRAGHYQYKNNKCSRSQKQHTSYVPSAFALAGNPELLDLTKSLLISDARASSDSILESLLSKTSLEDENKSLDPTLEGTNTSSLPADSKELLTYEQSGLLDSTHTVSLSLRAPQGNVTSLSGYYESVNYYLYVIVSSKWYKRRGRAFSFPVVLDMPPAAVNSTSQSYPPKYI